MVLISHWIQHNLYGLCVVRRKVFFYAASIVFILMLPLNYSSAGEVVFTPSLEVKESYTDNLFLNSPGNEQGDSVTEISPAFLLSMRGARFNASVDYTMQNLIYNKFRENNRTFNQLTATSTSEVLDDYLFFDADARHGQRIINTNSSIGANNIAITNNIANATSFGLSPYFKHSYKNFDALAQYRYSEVNYRRGAQSDSSQYLYDVRLNTPARKLGATWGVDFSNRRTDYVTGTDSTLIKNSLTLGYRTSRRAHFLVTGGKDENTYDGSSRPDINQSFWIVGTDLLLGGRDSVSVGYGERLSEPTGYFDWNHRARRLNFNVSYREEFSNSALTFIDTTQSIGANNSITTETFLQKLGSLGLTYNFSKTSVSVRYSDDQRKFQVSGNLTRNKSASLSINIRSTNRVTYVMSTIWSRRYDAGIDLSNFDTRVNLSMIRRLSPSLDLDFSLLHYIRRGQNSAIDYNENIASVSLTKEFN